MQNKFSSFPYISVIYASYFMKVINEMTCISCMICDSLIVDVLYL
jgi:NAD-dependent dihydropyrimidine dehydrogenase PreA subunit